MVLLQTEHISKSYGDLVLFNDLSLSIHKGDKVALIAKNGSGKTTLLNIICGLDTPDDGQITFRNNTRISYLPQNPQFNYENVYQTLYHSNPVIINHIQHYEHAIKSGDEKELSEAMAAMDASNAWQYENTIHQFISKLKLPEANTPINILSGGQKKRLALASSLLSKPDVLILDEPTNHLDVDMIEWLEDFLINEIETIFIVTHDRYFLEQVCNEIIELDNLQLYTYEGNYSLFLQRRTERIQQSQTEIEKARNLYRKELDWIRRMPKARTTKAKYRVQAFDEIEEKASKQISEKKVNIKTASTRLGKKILEINYMSKSFGDKVIVKDFSYKFHHNERIGIVGPNGCGKTTFLNLLSEK